MMRRRGPGYLYRFPDLMLHAGTMKVLCYVCENMWTSFPAMAMTFSRATFMCHSVFLGNGEINYHPPVQ